MLSDPDKLPFLPIPRRVLLCPPDFFDVIDVKNAHMEGQLGRVDKALARAQWEALKSTYESLIQEGYLTSVEIIQPVPDCEDMVFTANQSFPWLNEAGEKIAVLSRMRHPSRQREVPQFEAWYRTQGYKIQQLPPEAKFEGMGDCLHFNSRLLFGGSGFRTAQQTYTTLEQFLKTEILQLELVDEHFYHLDTCLTGYRRRDGAHILFACKPAFSPESWTLLRNTFGENLHEIPADEAAGGFALNAHLIAPPDGRDDAVAIVQRGNPHSCAAFRAAGLRVIELETSEFMKSGGSVFCMKMMVW